MSNTKSSFADNGYVEIVNATGTVTFTDGNMAYAIKAVNGADAVVTIVNYVGDSSTSLTIISGDTIYTTSQTVTVASGMVHAYKKKIVL